VSGAREQVSRLLALVPYLQTRTDVSLAQVAADFGVRPDQIMKDLKVLWMCGLPGLTPDKMIDVDFEAIEDDPDGVVRIDNADFLSRPVRLGSSEASALIVALRALREGSPDASHEVIDRCGALALAKGTAPPTVWPEPELNVPASQAAAWRAHRGLPDDGRPVVAFAPGAVGPSKRWPVRYFAELAANLTARGLSVWVLGSPDEAPLATEIAAGAGAGAHDLTSPDLRNAILALKCAKTCVSNDSGLVHVAAAIGVPTVAIFGPTSPWHWAPLNPLAAVMETTTDVPCRPCHKPVCRLVHHRCMIDIPPGQVLPAVQRALSRAAVN